jgi:hypothetical protein
MPCSDEAGMRAGLRRERRAIDAWVASVRSHPMVSDDGFASALTPWEAVQRAAWMAQGSSEGA